MRTIHLENIGPHKMWQFYLCYCESAFIERAIGTVQMLIMRPGARRDIIDY
ncbi:MAG: hypothetical protein OER22_07675 [Gammaproteobacteria bacterium]|nr:hypothetical protein [Gammaproteobacteria bacterium]MDH3410776.1 hypothetical protein [Gammaproteobacteria bacterium]MDH3552480.1 hypothetical protein [Gammaproteobacteria bacterium]